MTPDIVPRSNRRDTACAFLSLAWTQSRLAHRYKKAALEWEAKGNRANFIDCRMKSRKLWHDAKWNLRQARITK